MELNTYFFINKLEKAVSKQAFSERRENLDSQIFVDYNKEYVEMIYSQRKLEKVKNKYIITAIDGSSFEIPYSLQLSKVFGMQKGKYEREASRARVSGIYDCLNNIMINVQVSKFDFSERSLAIENIKEANKLIGKENKLLITMDRGYPSFEILYLLNEANIKYIIRTPNTTYGVEKKRMKTNDEIISIKVGSERIRAITNKEVRKEIEKSKKINTRMIKYTLENGTDEWLVTNLENDEFTGKEIGELYFERWKIETAYDVLKNKMYIENISGKSELAVKQDLYAGILAFNMIEDIKYEANNEITRKKENGKKYDYKINSNILIGTVKLCLIMIALEPNERKADLLYKKMMGMIKREMISVRPGRTYEHKTYRGRNKYKSNLRRNS
jgi:FOG: Transposase and inactivated derivatives